MRKLALRISISIDGFIAGPNGETDWMHKSRSPDGAAYVAKQMSAAGAHLLGRKAFAQMAPFWSTATGPSADAINNAPKIVFSNSGFNPSSVSGATNSWADAKVLSGDLSEEIRKLKQQEGRILLAHGGTSFAQNLVATGLVDEYWFAVHPIALAHGSHLFANAKAPIEIKLESTVSFSTGALANVYRVA